MPAGAAILVAGFGWGVLAQRNGWFPLLTVRGIAHAAGWSGPDLPPLVETSPKEFEPRLESLSTLRSVPYIGSLPAERRKERGVVLWDRERSSQGS